MHLPARLRDRDPGASRRAALAAGLLFVALALFGARFHRVEEAGSAERDGYVAQAETILAGDLPRDPYRPPLYPLLTAALGGAIGDPFTAARLLSNLAAAALAWIAWRTGRELGGDLGSATADAAGRSIGAWAFAATAVNPNLWILGQHTTTDMTFGALAAGALLSGLIYLERPGPRPAIIAGALLGLGAFTRGNAIFLVPALLFAIWFGGRNAGRARWRHLLYTGLAALPGFLALWAWRFAAFGDPFHDENWKNVAWKLYGYPDWSYLDRVPFHGLGEIVRADPAGIVRSGLSELWRFAEGGLAQLVGTPLHAALFLAAGVWLVARRDRAAAWLLASGAIFLSAIAVSFFTWGRFLLCLLPAANAILFAAPFREPAVRTVRSTARKIVILAATALVLSLGAKTAFRRLPAFVDRHPTAEIAVLQTLEKRLPPGTRIAGTSPFLGRYLTHPYLALPDAFGPELENPRLYLDRLERLVRSERIAYVLVGEIDLRDRPRSLLEERPPVPWLQPAERGPGITVWRVR